MSERTAVYQHERPPKGKCAHRNYSMTCAEFDVLKAAYGDACAICGRLGPETRHGFLVIDHDPHFGYWAVRGLLCSTCNSRIMDGVAFNEASAAYLADPWWRRWFAELGVETDMLPEPGLGAVVRGERYRYTHTKKGWECPSLWHCWGKLMTWRGLYAVYGPRKLTIDSGQLALADVGLTRERVRQICKPDYKPRRAAD
jgi:hypothetical protein